MIVFFQDTMNFNNRAALASLSISLSVLPITFILKMKYIGCNPISFLHRILLKKGENDRIGKYMQVYLRCKEAHYKECG